MTSETIVDDDAPDPSHCWCCGQLAPAEQTVRLGNHPEVALCLRCARFVAKRAREIEDQQRAGQAVKVRDMLRHGRRTVIEHGWQNNPIIGPALRWLGRHTP